jgi:3-phosphoinositide dependent protein kinase-1
LKPENLLLTLRGHLKLIDFDAAIVVPEEGDGDAAGGCRKGEEIACAGTSLYLPPEVVAGTVKLREAFALDLWALGCIIFLMLTGETPFHRCPEYILFERIMKGEYSFPKGFQYPKAQSIIEALLSPAPETRPGMGREGFEELKCHLFFGNSMASFNELLQCRPPPRVDRVARGVMASDWSEDSSHSFDFASSAECTPEVGQQFLSRHSAKIPVSSCNEGLSSEFSLSIQTDHNAMLARVYEPSASSSSAPPEQPSSPTRLAPAHVQRATQRFDDISAHSTPTNECRWLRPDRPFMSWTQWCRELVARQTLKEDEGVVICGSVVRRRVPCLRPKVLMLTDRPRLLLLNSAGLRLLKEFPLSGSGASAVVAKSHSDFELHTPDKRYYCYDCNGMEDWEKKIETARGKLIPE